MSVIVLPEIPARDMFVDNEQFYAALQSWQIVCQKVAERHTAVQPSPMPRRTQYLNTMQYYEALAAWESIFMPNTAEEEMAALVTA